MRLRNYLVASLVSVAVIGCGGSGNSSPEHDENAQLQSSSNGEANNPGLPESTEQQPDAQSIVAPDQTGNENTSQNEPQTELQSDAQNQPEMPPDNTDQPVLAPDDAEQSEPQSENTGQAVSQPDNVDTVESQSPENVETDAQTDEVTDSSTQLEPQPDTSNPTENIDESGSVTTQSNSAIQYVGAIFIKQRTSVEMIGTFHQQNESLNAVAEDSTLAIFDQCEVIRNGIAVDSGVRNGAEDPFDQIDNLPTVSAGETITLTGNAGTYATMLRTTLLDGQAVFYNLPNDISSPPPQGLELDIPGDQFPIFNNVAVPAVSALDLNLPSTQKVSADTEFLWTASNERLANVEINPYFTLANGDRLGVLCFPEDDGTFVFPAEVKSLIGDAESDTVFYSRSAYNFISNASAELWITNTWEPEN